MGLFKPYDEQATSKAKPDPAPAETGTHPGKKSVPTPTRRQAEAARRNRLQPVLTRKESKVKEREAKYKARDEANARVNARPEFMLIRDWVDCRWNIAEFALPGMLLIFVAVIVGGYFWAPLAVYSTYVIWAVFAILVGDTVWMWIGLRKRLMTYYPDAGTKGKFSYAFSRAMLMRRSRQPAVRVKRGTKFEWPNPEDHR